MGGNATGAAIALLFAAAICFAGWLIVSKQNRRTRDIQNLAERLGLRFVGKPISAWFGLDGRTMQGSPLVRNVIEGELGHVSVVAFDRRISDGDRSHLCTVVAARADASVFPATKFNSELTIERSGDWSLLCRPAEVMPVEELEAYLNDLAAGR